MRRMLKIYFSHPSIIALCLFFAALVVVIIDRGLLQHHLPWLIAPVLLAPFYEWVAHKYLLHAKLPENPGPYRNFLIRLHHGHHRAPHNIQLLFAPPMAIIIALTKFYLIACLLTASFTVALVPFATCVLYYLYYEWVHLGHHVPEYKHLTPYGKMMKRAHMLHHHCNENYWWGITNNLADLLFGTFKSHREVEKSPTVKNLSASL